MKKNFTLICLLSFSLTAHTQLTNIKLGYQEFPTTITGHASDSIGNMYYSGTFKGQLKAGGQILENGQGLQDIFLVKTNASGKVLYAKTFGSENDDSAPSDGLCYANNNLYLITSIIEDISFQSIAISPYQIASSNITTSCVINADTAGNVKWVNKTNLMVSKIYASNNIIHVFGTAAPYRGSVEYNGRRLYDSSGYTYTVHLMLDSSGSIINHKSITPRTTDQGMQNVVYIATYSDGKLCILLGPRGDQSFQFGQKTIALPNIIQNYFVLVKTDTAYANVSAKVLNNNSVNFLSTAGRSQFPMALSKQDSMYIVLTTDVSTPLSYDGLNVTTYRRNACIVLDSALNAARVIDLGSSYVGTNYNNTSRRRLFFRSMASLNNILLFTGVYAGVNESSINGIFNNEVNFSVLPNLSATVDNNGSSKSFAAKTALDFTNGSFNWIGDHTPHETSNLDQLFFHTVNDTLMAFSFSVDNVWNPWIINQNLQVRSGAMVKNADLADVSKYVEYLPDGSRIILGYANGRTALDSVGANLKSNRRRSDVFITRITSAGEVKWYKRFYCTLPNPIPKRLMIKDNKAFFLINYFGSINESNFLQINEKAYDMNASSSVLASVDTSGNITVINLENDQYKLAPLSDFNFFTNGDIGLLTSTVYNGSVTFGAFPPGAGSYVLRINKGANTIAAAKKIIVAADFYFDHIEIGNDDRICLSARLNGAGSVQNQFATLRIHNGTAFMDSVVVENNVVGQDLGGLGILSMTWNKLNWYKRTSGLNGFGLSGDFCRTFIMSDKILFTGNAASFKNERSAFYWDKQLVIPAMDFDKNYLFRLDTSGNMEMYKSVAGFSANAAKRRDNGTLILTGTVIDATSVDTFTVGYDGGVTDAVGIIYDSTLLARGVFRLATPYYERMQDMDIYKDSLVSFAYAAQTEPALKDYKFARLSNDIATGKQSGIIVTDYTEDAFLSSQVLKPNIALPLQLLSFNARLDNNTVSIDWKMASEDIKQCIVERSYNGDAFKNIDIKNTFNNASMVTYKTLDELKDYGQYYYRLKMISVDGSISYSTIIRVLYTAKKGSVYYDNNSRQLHILQSTNISYLYTIFDAGGKTILAAKRTTGSKIINFSTRPNGMYIIQITEEGTTSQSYKFIK